MKVLEILGAAGLSVALGGLVFYWGWLKAPSPREVCDNVARIRRGTGLELSTQGRAECERAAQPPDSGRVPWARQMRCMAEAKSEEALEACLNDR